MAESPAARTEFGIGWRAVPRGAWLAWAPSMLSLLDKDVGETLLPLLEVSSHRTVHAVGMGGLARRRSVLRVLEGTFMCLSSPSL